MQHLSILQLQQYPVATLISLKAINFITNEIKPIKPIFANEYEKFVGYLKHINANGFNIYFLPDYQILQQYKFIDFLFDDIKQEQIKQLESDLHILYLLETSKDNYQAVLRFVSEQKIDKELYLKINRYLVNRYQCDKGSIGTAHFFRLAGFTNRKEKYRNEKGLYPYVRIKIVGKINENLQDIIQQLPKDPPKQQIQIQSSANGNCERYIATIYERESHKYEDKSQLDYRIACKAIEKGFDTESIAQAIRTYSPSLQERHGRYVENYIKRTISNARQNFYIEVYND